MQHIDYSDHLVGKQIGNPDYEPPREPILLTKTERRSESFQALWLPYVLCIDERDFTGPFFPMAVQE